MATAVAAIGLGLSAGSTIVGGISADEIAKENAREIERVTAFNRKAKELEFRRVLGRARVTGAVSGVAIEEGSPLIVAEENLVIAEQNLENITITGAKEAAIQRRKGRAALLGGFLGGLGEAFFGVAEIERQRLQSRVLEQTETQLTRAARGQQAIDPNIFTGPDIGGLETIIGTT